MAEIKPKTSRATKSTKTTTKSATKKTEPKKKTEKASISTSENKVHSTFKGHEHFFELFCEAYLSRHKYGEVKINPKKSRDGGVDIRCFREDDDKTIIYYISCKNIEKVGPLPIREINGVTPRNLDDEDVIYIPMLMTSGKLTADAQKEAKKLGVQIIDGNKLAKEKRIG